MGFNEWNLDVMVEYQDLIKRIIEEGLKIATRDYECHAWFPIEDIVDGGKLPSDPTVICVELPLGEDEDNGPQWHFSLNDLVTNLIELNEKGRGGPIDPDARHALTAVLLDLRRLSDLIKTALERRE